MENLNNESANTLDDEGDFGTLDDFYKQINYFKSDRSTPLVKRKIYISGLRSHIRVCELAIMTHKMFKKLHGADHLKYDTVDFTVFFGTSDILEMAKKIKEMKKALKELRTKD